MLDCKSNIFCYNMTIENFFGKIEFETGRIKMAINFNQNIPFIMMYVKSPFLT